MNFWLQPRSHRVFMECSTWHSMEILWDLGPNQKVMGAVYKVVSFWLMVHIVAGQAHPILVFCIYVLPVFHNFGRCSVLDQGLEIFKEWSTLWAKGLARSGHPWACLCAWEANSTGDPFYWRPRFPDTRQYIAMISGADTNDSISGHRN